MVSPEQKSAVQASVLSSSMPENNSNLSSRTDRSDGYNNGSPVWVATTPETNQHTPSTGSTAAGHFKRDNFRGDNAAEFGQNEHHPDQGGDRNRGTGAQNIPPAPPIVMETPDCNIGISNRTSAPLPGRVCPCHQMTADHWGTETDGATEGYDTESRAIGPRRRLSTSMDARLLYGIHPKPMQRGSSSVGSVDRPRLDPQECVSQERRLSYAGLDPDLIRCRVCRGSCGTFCRRAQANREN
ncbi:MAG: hypothetical protein M1813_007339 [Trichoglossum hirsutum]|nr:MAG: hypothetical protein M1813_007339 [Trichoglossum hirsutum]